MSTKRVKAREEKRRMKQKNTLIITGCIAAALLIISVFALYGWNNYSKSYVMVFNGQKVDIGDFVFFGMFTSSEEVEDVKASALDQLLGFLVVDKAGKEHGLTVTEAEKEEAKTYASSFKSFYEQGYGLDMSFISEERLADILGQDPIYTQLIDIYTTSYTVDEDAFDLALDDYIENHRDDYYDMQLKYIYVSEQEKIEEAYQAIAAGMNFDEAIKQYSEYYSEDSGVTTYPLKDMGLDEDNVNRMLELKAGSISEIIETGSMYALFYVDSLTIPTIKEVAETYRESYIREQKDAMFREIIEEWKQEAVYTLNQKAYDAA